MTAAGSCLLPIISSMCALRHGRAYVKLKFTQQPGAQVIVRKEEEVLSLSGGGDWHMAYLLLYRARTVAA